MSSRTENHIRNEMKKLDAKIVSAKEEVALLELKCEKFQEMLDLIAPKENAA